MSGIIHLLPDSIANQIAAGEVIQRPASVVKELLENSIDAGADKMQLIIKDSGKSLIQVIDNGQGMSDTDARMSFERHATSKIRASEDLFTIRTMGFRGEALASIAAIAQVDLITKPIDENLGTHIAVKGSKVTKQEQTQCLVGTNIRVKNLFYNVPARRKFLKSDPVEFRHVTEEFQRLALAYPEKQFSLFHNDQELFHLTPGNLRQRIVALFGKNSNEQIVPLAEDTEIVQIKGFVGKPDFARKSRSNQYIFVNRRYIRSGYLAHAIRSCYENILAEESHPFYVLMLEIDPSKIDVNVHPSKHEIKFEDERIIYNIVRVSTRHALGQYNVTPSIDFDTENRAVLGGARIDLGGGTSMKSNLESWKELFEVSATSVDDNAKINQTVFKIESDLHSPTGLSDPIQIHSRYIIVSIKSGILLIDQQAAHERILYEEFLDALKKSRSLSQQQLFPQTIEIQSGDVSILRSMIPNLKKLGFDVEEFGQNTFILRGMNASIHESISATDMIETLLYHLKDNKSMKIPAEENLARSLSKSSAIKASIRMSTIEMKELIDRLFACETPYIAPDGRKCFISFSLSELEKRFQT